MTESTSEQLVRIPDWREAIGLEQLFAELAPVLDSGRMHPVILLQGPVGIGKRHAAAWIAARLLCKNRTACGHCAPCKEVLAGLHPDVLWIESRTETTIKTAAMESLQQNLSVLSSEGLRVAVIVDCEKMTREAANRMLKTLEEPPDQVRLILTSSRPKALLPTVLGRCLRWRMRPPAQEAVLSWFKQELISHQRIVEDEGTLIRWVHKSGCSPGVLRAQLEDVHDGAAAIDDRMGLMMRASHAGEAIRHAEDLVRHCGAKTADILAAAEWVLNRDYRNGYTAGDASTRMRRRALVRDLRRKAVLGQTHLNTQLVTESIGLVPFCPEIGVSS